jgi:cation transporter-like permease
MGIMARRSSRSKFSVLALIEDQYHTLYTYSPDGRRLNFVDFLVFLGVPSLGALGVFWTKAEMRHVPEVLAAIAILTGLTFNVFVLLFDLMMRAVDRPRNLITGPDVVRLADELRANVSYAVLLGLVLSAFLGGLAMFTDTDRPVSTAFSCVAVFLGVQLLMTLGMCLKRVRAVFRVLQMKDEENPP